MRSSSKSQKSNGSDKASCSGDTIFQSPIVQHQDAKVDPLEPQEDAKVIGAVLELKRAKSYKPVQFPPPDFDSVETTESFPLATGRCLLVTGGFEAGSL
ncbi:hypothetical protein L3X38_024585 [Prunus dulcis]|uniref:Uncharacterized protein n=1 Tax=Prunus dulcis TaxID=3755 RepID=A0AAD4W220_PRUDU|nr:hypothetical protein L3X38_024585 [Prunus dulcis]